MMVMVYAVIDGINLIILTEISLLPTTLSKHQKTTNQTSSNLITHEKYLLSISLSYLSPALPRYCSKLKNTLLAVFSHQSRESRSVVRRSDVQVRLIDSLLVSVYLHYLKVIRLST
jgi:hypothetical protein